MPPKPNYRFTTRLIELGISCLFLFPIMEASCGPSEGYSTKRIITVLLMYCALASISAGAIFAAGTLSGSYSKSIRRAYVLLIIWCLVVILKSVSIDLHALNQLFNKADGAGPWILPVVMIVGGQLIIWKKLNTMFITHTILGIVIGGIVLFFGKESTTFSTLAYIRFGTAYAAGFLLLSWGYQSGLGKIAGLIGLMTYGWIGLFSGRRHTLITVLYYVCIFMIIRFFQEKNKHKKIKNIFVTFVVLIVLMVISILAINVSSYANRKYEIFVSRLTEDTRTVVIKEFIKASTNDVATFVTGSGALGTYKSLLFLNKRITQRPNIENGYLQLIHKGGLLLLVLFLFLTIPAAFLGILFSDNLFTRICGFVVFGRLLDMVFYGLPWSDPSYVLFWLSVGACLNRKFRKMKEPEIMQRSVPMGALQ